MNQVEEILGRLRFYFRAKNDTSLADLLGIPYKTLDGWKTRKSIPISRLRDISNSKKLPLDWILEGGPVGTPSYNIEYLKEEKELKKKNLLATNKNLNLDELRTKKERVQGLKGNVPIRYFENVTASAGYGSNNSDESFEEFEVGADFLRTVLQVKPTKYGYDMIRVLGDSMEPFVQDGNIIVIDRHTDIKNGDVVIANLGQDTFTKKFLRDPLHNSIKLTSLSEYYQDIVLRGDEIEELRIVGKVVCKFSINMKVF